MPLWDLPSEKKIHQGNDVSIPRTTKAKIIFPYKSGAFDKTYNPKRTNHRVSSEQVDEVLSFINKTVKGHLACVNVFGVLLLLAIVAAFFSLFWEFNDINLQRETLVGMFVIGVPLICLMAAFRHRRLNQARTICQESLDIENQKLAGTGVRWALPGHFPMWIELHNDFVSCSQASTQPNTPIVIPQAHPVFKQVEFKIQYQENTSPKNSYKPPQQFHQQEDLEI